MVDIFIIFLLGGNFFFEELYTWKLVNIDKPRRKPAAINLIVNALLIINPLYKMIESKMPVTQSISKDRSPMYPNIFKILATCISGILFSLV